MSCPKHGPCTPFVTALDLCCLEATGTTFPNPCLTGGTSVPAEAITDAITAASELMWAMTGRRFGKCQVKIRPCRQSCEPCGDLFSFTDFGFGFSFPFFPQLLDGVWFNLPPCGCPGLCGCEKLCEVDLPTPVCTVDEVKVDGVVLPPSAYRVDDFRKLVRIDGVCWPECQDLEKPDTELDTFSVTVTYGREVPTLIKTATGVLACELLKACVGAPCSLPQRVTTITRQGITAGFLDPQQFFNEGRIGIYIVDLVIQTFNPHGISRRPAVWSPDAGPNWRRVGT